MNPRRTKTILSVWSIIFLLTTSFFVLMFLEVEKIKIETDNLNQKIIEEKKASDSFNSLVRTVENIKENSEKISKFFIKKEEVVNFLDKIESLASDTNTQISIQSVTEKKIPEGGSLISVGISAQGTYSNVNYLIRMLEELPYQTEIQSVNLSKQTIVDDKKQSSVGWSGNIIVVGIMF